MFEMIVGYPPFYSEDPMSTCGKIVHWRNFVKFPDQPVVADVAKDFICRLLCDVEHRCGTRVFSALCGSGVCVRKNVCLQTIRKQSVVTRLGLWCLQARDTRRRSRAQGAPVLCWGAMGPAAARAATQCAVTHRRARHKQLRGVRRDGRPCRWRAAARESQGSGLHVRACWHLTHVIVIL